MEERLPKEDKEQAWKKSRQGRRTGENWGRGRKRASRKNRGHAAEEEERRTSVA